MKACDYWEEMVANSLEENGIVATKEQVLAVASDMQISHECYGQAFYQPTENPERAEVKRLEKALQREREAARMKAEAEAEEAARLKAEAERPYREKLEALAMAVIQLPIPDGPHYAKVANLLSKAAKDIRAIAKAPIE